ncbi:MAG TPA: MFS transporter [Verrucomicrobiae bacterium]|nr:MFS transporter [Verrucomicrobiae bacterium]
MSISQQVASSPRFRWFVLANVSLGTFMATLDSSIVNVALPTISSQLSADLPTVQWVVAAYLLTISSLLPVFGRIADLFGRKKIYSSGFLLFTLGSLLCGISNSIWFLVSMRVIQAIGAAMMMANSAAIVTSVFPPKERGRALGLIGTVVALGSLTGPALGGILVGLAGWRSIFYLNLPIGIIAYIAAQIVLPRDNPNQAKESFDFAGAFLFTLGMITLLLGISNGHDWGWTSLPVLSALLLGVLCLGMFIVTESKVKHPLIDISLFRIRAFWAGNLAGLLSFVAMFSNTMLMPFYLQHILGYNPSMVGLLMTSFPVVMAVVAPVSGHISDRTGPVILTTGGLVTSALGLLYLANLTATASAWQVIPGPVLMGLGAGMFNSPNNSSVMGSVPPPKLGVASGINALVRNVGMVSGIAFSVSLFESHRGAALQGILNPTPAQDVAAFMSAYHIVLYSAAVIALAAALISLNRKTRQQAGRPAADRANH